MDENEPGVSSLTGFWRGRYGYADGTPPVSFEATLMDLGGAVTGATQEDQPVVGAVAATLQIGRAHV